MTILELRDARATTLAENDKIFEVAETENRAITETENGTVEKNLQRLRELDLKIANEERKTENKSKFVSGPYILHPVEPFSLLKAIRAKVEQREMPGLARDIFKLGQMEARYAGISTGSDLVIPQEVRANILAGTATQGQEIVAEDKKAIIPPLTETLVFSKMGCTFMNGLVGNVSIPAYAGTTTAWKTEVEAAADGGGAFTEVVLDPKRMTAYLYVSKTFLAQDGVGAERLLLSNIGNSCARLLEATVLGVAAGSTTQPAGMAYHMMVTSAHVLVGAAPTYAALVAMETAVDTANALAGNLAYLTNSIGRGILKSIDKGVANDTGEMLMGTDGMVNGYPCFVTNSATTACGNPATSELLVFGNWADLIIAQWGGYDITVDPYSRATTNQVVIVINAYVDAKCLRGTVGAGADKDDYAYSFNRIPITP